MSLLEYRKNYKPFDYPWAFESYETQLKMIWTLEEISLSQDLTDWSYRLTDKERNLLKQILRFFTQTEVDVAGGYIDHFLPNFKPPEVRMMLSMFAATEALHQQAYSFLLDSIGMPESAYSEFLEYQEMLEKHEHTHQTSTRSLSEIARSLAVYSAFTEGVQLFSSFAIILNFPRHNKMVGTGQVVTWALRDEDLHVSSMIRLFREFVKEHPKIWTDSLKKEVYQAARDSVALEDRFIDLVFELGGIEGLTPDEVKRYIRYITDRRLLSLGMKPEFEVSKNPLTWMPWMISLDEHADFFSVRPTSYSKGSLSGSWDDVWRLPNRIEQLTKG